MQSKSVNLFSNYLFLRTQKRQSSPSHHREDNQSDGDAAPEYVSEQLSGSSSPAASRDDDEQEEEEVEEEEEGEEDEEDEGEEEEEDEEEGEKEDEGEEEEEYERRVEGNDYDTRSEAGDSRSASSVSFSDDGESAHSASGSDVSGRNCSRLHRLAALPVPNCDCLTLLSKQVPRRSGRSFRRRCEPSVSPPSTVGQRQSVDCASCFGQPCIALFLQIPPVTFATSCASRASSSLRATTTRTSRWPKPKYVACPAGKLRLCLLRSFLLFSILSSCPPASLFSSYLSFLPFPFLFGNINSKQKQVRSKHKQLFVTSKEHFGKSQSTLSINQCMNQKYQHPKI